MPEITSSARRPTRAAPGNAAGIGTTSVGGAGALTSEAPAPTGWRAVWSERSVRVGVILVLVVLAGALLAPWVAHVLGHGPNQQFPDRALSKDGVPIGPSSDFWLGADGTGRDVLVRTLYGARVSLLVGLPATLVAMVVGTAVGVASGFLGGRVDTVLSQVVDAVLSFPFVVTALSMVALNRSADGSPRVDPVVLLVVVIAGFSWTWFARLTRGLTVELRSRPFIEAAQTLGVSRWRLMTHEVLPNVAPVVVVFAAVQLPANIVAEATLSFLGIGVQAPTASWGSMIADAQRTALYQIQPAYLLGPALGLILTVVAFNTLGNGLRTVLDPQRGR